MARPRKQDQFAAVPDNDCGERIVHIEAVHAARSAQQSTHDLAQLSALLGLTPRELQRRVRDAVDRLAVSEQVRR